MTAALATYPRPFLLLVAGPRGWGEGQRREPQDRDTGTRSRDPDQEVQPEMTDRYAAFVVTLDTNVREDDAEDIVTALKMVKHVATVEPVVADYDLNEQVRRQAARYEVQRMLIKLLNALDDAEKRPSE